MLSPRPLTVVPMLPSWIFGEMRGRKVRMVEKCVKEGEGEWDPTKFGGNRRPWLNVVSVVNKLDRFVDNTIDLPWRNFPRLEFGTKFQSNVPIPLFWRSPNLLITQQAI